MDIKGGFGSQLMSSFEIPVASINVKGPWEYFNIVESVYVAQRLIIVSAPVHLFSTSVL